MIKELSKKKKKGFSLVELIVVIAIIGILAAIAVPKYSHYQQTAKVNADKSTAKNIANAVLMAQQTGSISFSSIASIDQGKDDDSANWKIISDFISDVNISSSDKLLWKIFIDKTNNKILVYGDEKATAASKAQYELTTTIIKAELEY